MAQTEADKVYIIKQTNVEVLQKIAEKSKNHYLTHLKRRRADSIQITNIKGETQVGYLSGFDQHGKPIYDYDDNEITAITGRVNKIWSDDFNFYRLDGNNIKIGHWEAEGLALINHQELDGRITHAEPQGTSGHATHTAGTILGRGVNREGRGMASHASIISRQSDNDEAEIAQFASQGGILSNHSYRTGDPLGDTPLYGMYSANAAEWDNILYNAPFLLASKSAGNNRNDDVNIGDGGYDVLFTIALSKNLLTVGACLPVLQYEGPTAVKQSAFSSWGPTDDWRIKPDLVTNGMEVLSANSQNIESYRTRSGTSMSAAAVTGTIALLQQLYHKLNGVYMKSATVKALLLGTTDEAGEYDGPDFQNGWGLLNAKRAAETILNNGIGSQILELSLINGTTYTTEIETDGVSPISLAIAWTDPAGTPTTEKDDPTPILVNDLDVRIKGNGMVYYPWTMTPNEDANNFTDPATKGDNFRDNIERIDIAKLPEGKHTVEVTHKGSLGKAQQNFSMVIYGLLDNVVSIENPSDNDALMVYPNPSKNGKMQLSIPEKYQAKEYVLNLYSVNGTLIQHAKYYENLIDLNLSHLSAGSYILGLQIEGKLFKKLILID